MSLKEAINTKTEIAKGSYLFRYLQNPGWHGGLALITVAITISSIIAFLSLFVYTATSRVLDNNDNDDAAAANGNDDDDDDWEERSELKLALSLLFLTIACGSLLVPLNGVWHSSKGSYDRFHLGLLSACMFMVGNMMFVAFCYSFGQGEDNDHNGNNNNRYLKNYNKNSHKNGNDRSVSAAHSAHKYEMMNEPEVVAHHYKVVSTWSFLFAMAFFALSAVLYYEGKRLRESTKGEHHQHVHVVSKNNDETATTATTAALPVNVDKASTHIEKISTWWGLLTTCSAILLPITLTMAYVHREEVGAASLLGVLAWIIAVTVLLHVLGHVILGDKKWGGTLGVGMLTGGATYFALLLLMVAMLYAHVTYDERNANNDGDNVNELGATTVTALVCLFLSLLHFAFAFGAMKYQSSMLSRAIEISEEEDDITVIEGAVEVGEMNGSTGDFIRVEDHPDEEEQQLDAEDANDAKVEPNSATGDYSRLEDDLSEGQVVLDDAKNVAETSATTEDYVHVVDEGTGEQ